MMTTWSHELQRRHTVGHLPRVSCLVVLVLSVVLTSCTPALRSVASEYKKYSTPTREVNNDDWDAVFQEDTRIAFGVAPDGRVIVYLREERNQEFEVVPIDRIVLQAIAVEIVGPGSKPCWKIDGEKECDPPPPPY